MIELSGAFQIGTAGEQRQEFYTKLIEFYINEPNRSIICTQELVFRPNKLDEFCIEVLFRLEGSPRDGYSLGYIPRTINKDLLDWISNYSSKFYKNIEKCATRMVIQTEFSYTGQKEYRISLIISTSKFKKQLFPIKSRIANLL